jgi:hypothetical protein
VARVPKNLRCLVSPVPSRFERRGPDRNEFRSRLGARLMGGQTRPTGLMGPEPGPGPGASDRVRKSKVLAILSIRLGTSSALAIPPFRRRGLPASWRPNIEIRAPHSEHQHPGVTQPPCYPATWPCRGCHRATNVHPGGSSHRCLYSVRAAFQVATGSTMHSGRS